MKTTYRKTVTRQEDGRYSTLTITVYRVGAYGGDNRVLELNAQTDEDTKRWYGWRAESGGDMVYSGATSADDMRDASRLVGKLQTTGKWDDAQAVWDQLPGEWCVKDDRESRLVSVSDVKPLEWRRWMAIDGAGCCEASTIAESEDAARLELTAEMAASAAKWDGRKTRFEAWLEAGRPVRVDDIHDAPVIPTADTFKARGV